MRHAFISILVILALSAPSAMGSDIGKDGFNFYKDYLRGRSDEVILDVPEDYERVQYFYRTPVQLYSGFVPRFDQQYRKRTNNAYKNYLLSKTDADIPRKRSSKTALSYMLQSKSEPITGIEKVLKDNVDMSPESPDE